MVEEVEDDVLDCKTILIIGAVVISGFFIWNFYNTSRLHDLVQQLLNRPEPIYRTHDGEHMNVDTERVMKTQNGRIYC